MMNPMESSIENSQELSSSLVTGPGTYEPDHKALRDSIVGQTLWQVATPAVVLDIAKIKVNCRRMLDAVHQLGISWRAHIKTHKTVELTRLQVGDDDSTPVNLVVSTVLEAENITPLLREYQGKGRAVNVLYAFPLYKSAVSRLASVSAALGPDALSVMIDRAEQLACVRDLFEASGNKALVFVKVDAGYKRAGVSPSSEEYRKLVSEVLAAEALGSCVLHGLYVHAGQSYDTRDDWAAMDYLAAEYSTLNEASKYVCSSSPNHRLVLSAGATPTATTLQHSSFGEDAPGGAAAWPASISERIKVQFNELKEKGITLEAHAGVYPVLDLQQLASHARDSRLLSPQDIGISVVADVASLYPGRGPGGVTEALINAGNLALGREPVKKVGEAENASYYQGWGILMPWGLENPAPTIDFPRNYEGFVVARISQEHGILQWLGQKEAEVPLAIGQRVRVWPNHACIAGAGYERYLVVDSSCEGKEDEIVDVWYRWRGW